MIIEGGGAQTQAGYEARRARLGTRGELASGLAWKVEFDLGSIDESGARFADAYLHLKTESAGDLYLGHLSEPFSLMSYTSSRFVRFTERADLLDPGRSIGVLWSDANASWTAQCGAFWITEEPGLIRSRHDTAYTMRVVYRPIFEAAGRRIAHLGLAASAREAPGGGRTLSSQGGVHQLEGSVLSAQLDAQDGILQTGMEAAFQAGAWAIQAEHVRLQGDHDVAQSWYLQSGYFLTGESRNYSTELAAWRRIRANEPAWRSSGAWEIAARLSQVDLSEIASQQRALTSALALNWYMTEAVRVQFSVYHTASDALSESLNAAVLRLGFDF